MAVMRRVSEGALTPAAGACGLGGGGHAAPPEASDATVRGRGRRRGRPRTVQGPEVEPRTPELHEAGCTRGAGAGCGADTFAAGQPVNAQAQGSEALEPSAAASFVEQSGRGEPARDHQGSRAPQPASASRRGWRAHQVDDRPWAASAGGRAEPWRARRRRRAR